MNFVHIFPKRDTYPTHIFLYVTALTLLGEKHKPLISS
jgi:predicted cation transporter